MTPRRCKCNHIESDHENKRKVVESVLVKKWRGSCNWSDCNCEKYEKGKL